MRVIRNKVAPVAVFLILAAPVLCLGAPLSQIIQYHLATRTFSQLHASIQDGQYDMIGASDLAEAVLETQGGLSDLEREALVEQLLIRAGANLNASLATGDGSVSGTEIGRLVRDLLGRFASIGAPTLRSRVLLVAHDFQIEGTSAAVLESARRLVAMLSDSPGVPLVQGYAVEATTLASIAPAYPSTALAEMLRGIAMHSADRRVVTASRDAARAILAPR